MVSFRAGSERATQQGFLVGEGREFILFPQRICPQIQPITSLECYPSSGHLNSIKY